MEQSLGSLSSAVALLAGAAIWTILFVVILGVLKRACLFPRWARNVLAVCASLLSVIGMSRIFSGGPGRSDGAGRENLLEFLLLPYAAMGIAMLLVLLLLLLRRTRPSQEEADGLSKLTSRKARDLHDERRPSRNRVSLAAREETRQRGNQRLRHS
jgi:tellurite resistance protein TehA-like permease